MKRIFYTLLVAVLSFTQVYPSFAVPQLGITPCVISAQPADLAFSGTSQARRMSTCGETVIVYNPSSSDVRYRLGTASTTTAVITDLLLPASSFVVLNVGLSAMYIAFISTGTGTISFVQGTANS